MTQEDYRSNTTLHDKWGKEVIRIDKEGFHYNGQFIADAGEAHRLMVEFLKNNSAIPSDSTACDLIKRLADAREVEQEFYGPMPDAKDSLLEEAYAYLDQHTA